jgi:hypothetical protein
MTKTTEHSGIHDAVNAAGTQDQLAVALQVTQQAVSAWLRQGWVPIGRAEEIETMYGIPRNRLVNPRIVLLMDAA